jgi:hypothetical protein
MTGVLWQYFLNSIFSRTGFALLFVALVLATVSWLAQGLMMAAISGAALYVFFIVILTLSRYTHDRGR